MKAIVTLACDACGAKLSHPDDTLCEKHRPQKIKAKCPYPSHVCHGCGALVSVDFWLAYIGTAK